MFLWVIEMFNADKAQWEPTNWVHCSRTLAREDKITIDNENPRFKFRIRKYIAE